MTTGECVIFMAENREDLLQINKLAEEQAELQYALRNNDREAIAEEIADNILLFRQFMIKKNIPMDEIETIIEFKAKRTVDIIKNGGNPDLRERS